MTVDPSEFNDITRRILAGAIEVHRTLGPRLLESIYTPCLHAELTARQLRFVTQRAIPIVYKGMRLESSYRIDLIVADLVVVELKSTTALLPVHQGQVLTYLEITKCPAGLLINFNVPRLMDSSVPPVNSVLSVSFVPVPSVPSVPVASVPLRYNPPMITHEIIGDDMQAVVITLASGDEVRAEAGAMTYMTDGIEMDARMEGGLLGGLKRKFLAGESLFLTFFRCHTPSAKVAFSGPYPGKILKMPLQNSAILCQRDSFLCAAGHVDINIEFTKRLGAGFFGGEGFILQRLEGTGDVFIHSGGTVIPMELKAGEKLRVDTGCLTAFDPTVQYDIEFVGGIRTALFGGEGLFFASMTGPGRVWIQTLPFSRLADRIMRAHRGDKEDVKRDLGGALGAIGDLIGGDS